MPPGPSALDQTRLSRHSLVDTPNGGPQDGAQPATAGDHIIALREKPESRKHCQAIAFS